MIPSILFLMIEFTLFLIADAKSDDERMLPSLVVVERFGLELPLSIEQLLSVVA